MKDLEPLIERYKELCINRYIYFTGDTEYVICQKPGNETSYIHLVWMLDEIKNNDTMSITKKHRWLGYVQGIMVVLKLISVSDERDNTRDILNGN
jgi:hypothetical protein